MAACKREVFEEVGLEVEVVRPVHQDDDVHYFLCALKSRPIEVRLAENECSDYRWVRLQNLTEIGPIMEFRRMRSVLRALGETI